MKRIAILAALVLAAAAAAGAQTRSTFPKGVFRTKITDADLRKGHATEDLAENHGTFTLTLTPGRWKLVQKAPNGIQNPVIRGTDVVKGKTVDFKTTFPTEFAGIHAVARWGFDGKYLRFKVTKAPYPEQYVLYDAHPWRKVG
jgi:hypothetical protein